MRIAVIGGGSAGLVAARKLGDKHEVCLYEAGSQVGGHCQTKRVEIDGGTFDIDLGVCLYLPRSYPNLTKLLAENGVKSYRANSSFSYRDEHLNLLCRGRLDAPLFLSWGSMVRPAWRGFARDVARIWSFSRRHTLPPDHLIGDLIAETGVRDQFVNVLVFHFLSFTFGISRQQVFEMPSRLFLATLDRWGLFRPMNCQAMAVVGGFTQFSNALAKKTRGKILLYAPVEWLVRTTGGVEVVKADGRTDRFDAVVLALPADRALRLLADSSEEEQRVLETFVYQPMDLVLHRDRSVLGTFEGPDAAVMSRVVDEEPATHLEFHLCPTVVQKSDTNAELYWSHCRAEPDPAQVITRRRFYHLIPTQQTEWARGEWEQISGLNRTYYCGSYWGDSLQESAVTSGLEVSRQINAWAMVA